MESPLPTRAEIDELLRFLPLLYADGFSPVKKWRGGETRDGVTTLPWPDYDELVIEFFDTAARQCWCDYEYLAHDVDQMFRDPDAIAAATLSQIKTMLTFCVRGERFCDGYWEGMIEDGPIQRLLERLSVLRQ